MRPRENDFGIFPKNVCDKIIYYYWIYDANGKRRFRSTGKRNRDEAVKFCRQLQKNGQLDNNSSLSFDKYTQNFFIYDECPYITHRVSRGHTYGRPWAKRQRQLLNTIITPQFGQTNIKSISFEDIDFFIMSLKKLNHSHKKINHVITTLRCIFNYAEMKKIIDENPCTGIKPFKVNSPEKGILTKQELEALFAEEKRTHIWPETMHYIINVLAACTGMRIGEILALKPQDISGGEIRVSHSYNTLDKLKSTKNGKTRCIPLNQELQILLHEYSQGKQPTDFLFSVNNGVSPVDHKTIYKRFWSSLEKIGITKIERQKRNISFHSYRHGFNTRLLEAGVHPETIRLLTGHSPSMTGRYAHIQLSNVLEFTVHREEAFKKNIE